MGPGVHRATTVLYSPIGTIAMLVKLAWPSLLEPAGTEWRRPAGGGWLAAP